MRIVVTLSLCLFLTGCAVSPTAAPTPERGLSIRGNVHGGQQPISGSHVYLFAANTTGYGQPSVSTLSPSAPGAATDSIGTYVTSDTNGAFTITGDYTCTPNTQLYLYALGGNPGAGINSAAGLLAILGQCPASGSFASSVPYVTINEITTIAAAYAIAGFATDATHVSSSGTPLAQTGIANAFASASNLADISVGASLTTTPAGNGTVPQAEINTLANILAACINSTSSSSTSCSTLFSNALSGGTTGTAPTDTATAAINIAHNPGSNIANLFSLSSARAQFSPTMAFAPTDFTVGLVFTGGASPKSIAIDASGNVWITNSSGFSVTELSSLGAPLSPAGGYTSPEMRGPSSIAIDSLGNAWVTNVGSSSVTKLSPSGIALSGSTGFTGGLSGPSSIAIDASDNVWVTNSNASVGVTKFSNTGTVLSPVGGFTGGGINGTEGIAIDAAGNAWISNSTNAIAELSNSGTPVSPATGYTGGGIHSPCAIAVDASGNIWNANTGITNNASVSELSNSGTPISPASGYEISESTYITFTGIAIDGSGNAWLSEYAENHQLPGIIEYSPSGSIISPSVGYGYSTSVFAAMSIAIDGSGNVWAPNASNGITEMVGLATPVATPISVGVKNNTLGTRP